MVSNKRRLDLVIDEKTITTEGKQVELRIDGVPVYKLERDATFFKTRERSPEDFKAFNISLVLRVLEAMFGYPDRYKIVVSLKGSPKTFTEIQNSLGFKAATLDFHLKKLLKEMAIGRTDKKYALTIVGEVFLDYFSDLLKAIESLQR